MQFRSLRLLRTFLLPTLLLSMTLLWSALPAGATSGTAQQKHYFQPSGHGVAIPAEISTATTPQMPDTQSAVNGPAIHHAAQIQPAVVPAAKQVIPVAPPTSIDSKAFAGMPDSGTRPADANGAGGSLNYFETVNHHLAIFSRSGTAQYNTTFDTWFSYPANYPLFDPNVVWDGLGHRFIFVVDTGASLLLSVAKQANALGKFCNYKLPTTQTTGADFDKLGVNDTGIYASVNFINSNGVVVSNELFYASRTLLENCGKLTYTYWTGLTNPDNSIAQAIVPAVQNASTSGIEYLVSAYPAGACKLTLWTSDGTHLSNTDITTQCYSPPPPAPEKGSSATINPDDSSLSHVSYSNGLLTMATQSSYDWGDGNGPEGIVAWFVLNPATASVLKQGSFGTPGVWLLYPAAVRNSAGNMLFVYNASGPKVDPSIWYVNQTFKNAVALARSTSYYQKNGEAPWGDYQSAWLDTSGSNPNEVWITGQYAQSKTTWSTEFALVKP